MATYNTIVALLENPFKVIAQKNFFYRFSGYNHSKFFLVCVLLNNRNKQCRCVHFLQFQKRCIAIKKWYYFRLYNLPKVR